MTPLQAALGRIKTVADFETIDQQLDYYRAAALMIEYHERWAESTVEPVEVEGSYCHPIYHPTDDYKTSEYVRAGKKDVIVRDTRDDTKWLMEHKTTISTIYPTDVVYWANLPFSSQVSGYMLSELLDDVELDGCIYDVIKKTKTKPRKLNAKQLSEVRETGKYCNMALDDDEYEYIRRDDADRESPRMYGARFRCEVHDMPDMFFARKRLMRTREQLIDYGRDLWNMAEDVHSCDQDSDKFYKNTDSCQNFNTACKYLGVCSGVTALDDERFIPCAKTDLHPELDISGFDGDPMKILTHSSLHMFQTCRKKFYLHHRLNLRTDRERTNALYFGDLMHQGLEAYFIAKLPKTGDA